MKKRGISLFSTKAVFLVVMVYLILATGNYAMTHDGTWKQYQNPRTRLLWDRLGENERIALLGDSVLTSYYTDRESETIWRRLEASLNRPVFNGSLQGAKESDLLLATRLISQQGSGRVVIIDLTPSRFLRTNEPEKRGGNYNTEIGRKLVTSYIDFLTDRLLGTMPILDKQVIRNTINKEKSFKGKQQGNFSWRNNSSLAVERMTKLDRMYVEGDNVKPFDLVVRLNNVIEESGNHALFVLTPLNSGLLKWYAEQGQRNYLPVFNAIHDSLVQYLDHHKIRYLDLFDGPDEDCFVDSLHTNTCGDLFMADKIAGYLTATNMVR